MTQIECPFCGAYATKIPGPTVHFSDWEEAIVTFRKAAFWGLPLDSRLKRFERTLAGVTLGEGADVKRWWRRQVEHVKRTS